MTSLKILTAGILFLFICDFSAFGQAASAECTNCGGVPSPSTKPKVANPPATKPKPTAPSAAEIFQNKQRQVQRNEQEAVDLANRVVPLLRLLIGVNQDTNPGDGEDNIDREETTEANARKEKIEARRQAASQLEATEEDERAAQREKMYKAQRAKERANVTAGSTAPGNEVCGWRGLVWFNDLAASAGQRETLAQMRKRLGTQDLAGNGIMILKIFKITEEGQIAGTLNGKVFSGAVSADRTIHLASGDKTNMYEELSGLISSDGQAITGTWYTLTTGTSSRGTFALESECPKASENARP